MGMNSKHLAVISSRTRLHLEQAWPFSSLFISARSKESNDDLPHEVLEAVQGAYL